MSNAVKVWIYKSEVSAQILRSPEVRALLGEISSKIAARAGDGYEAEVKQGSKRCYATVRTATAAAKKDNADNNTLLRALK